MTRLGTGRKAAAPERTTKQHAIHALILRNPGIHMSEIQRELGVGWGTVAYHVRVLRSSGRIVEHRAGREARLFAAGVSPQRMTWVAATHHPVHAPILEALARNPGARADELATAFGLTPNVVRRHLSALAEQGLVGWTGLHGRRYFIRPSSHSAIEVFLQSAPGARAGALNSPPRRYDGDASRDRILAIVRGAPGIHTGELVRVSGIAWGNLTHHVRILEEEGRVVRRRYAARSCFFTPEVPEEERPLHMVRRQELAARILEALGQAPGARVADIAKTVGSRPSAVHRHLEHLVQEGLVRPDGGERFQPVFPAQPLLPAPPILPTPTDIELV